MSQALLQTHLATLFRLDSEGRMLAINEPDDPPAPQIFLGRAINGNVWAVRHDTPTALAEQLRQLCAAEPALTTPGLLPHYAPTIRTLLGLGAPEWHGPAFIFPQPIPRVEGATLITEETLSLLDPYFSGLKQSFDACSPIAVVLEKGVAASACWCSRRTDNAAEAGAHTETHARRRGYAAAAVATWAQAILESGRMPMYSTAWGNRASQGVVRRLGLELYGETWSFG